MTELILACDIGTSQCKVSLFDLNGQLVAAASEEYPLFYGPGNVVEQRPEDWWAAFIKASQRLTATAAEGRNYACIAFSAQMSACLPVDRAGTALRPAMIWADQRATAEADLFERLVGRERLYRITGNPPSPTYTGPKIVWLKKHEPEVFERTAYFIQPKDYLVYRLTGTITTDFSDASCTSLFDLEKRVWAEEILEALDIQKRQLPEAVPSTTVVGRVTPEAAAITSLPEGVPVVIGGGDGPAASVGAGVVASSAGYINLGSSAWISFCQDKPLYDREQRTFNYCHLVPGMYASTGTMQSAGSAYSWAVDNLFHHEKLALDELRGDLHAALGQRVTGIEPGCQGLIFLPYLVGERTPYWDPFAKGAFIGLRPDHDRYHMLRAVMESIGLHLRLIQEVFAAQGVSSHEFTMIGGGANNNTLLQLLADILPKQLRRGSVTTGATSFGAAVVGAVGIGLLKDFAALKGWLSEPEVIYPDPAKEERYSAIYQRFQLAYQALRPFFESAEP